MNSSHQGFSRPSFQSSQLEQPSWLGLDSLSLQHGQKILKLEQSLSWPCLFSSLSDCCPSLPDAQSFEKCCFICFVLFFSYFWWEGKCGLCNSILAGSPAATFEALSHQSTLNFREGTGLSSSSCLAGTGFLVYIAPKTTLPTTSFSLPTTLHFHTLLVSKERKNPSNKIWKFFLWKSVSSFGSLFGVLYLFYWDVSVIMEGDNLHRAWHIKCGSGHISVTLIFSDSSSPCLKNVSQILAWWGTQSNTSLPCHVGQEPPLVPELILPTVLKLDTKEKLMASLFTPKTGLKQNK